MLNQTYACTSHSELHLQISSQTRLQILSHIGLTDSIRSHACILNPKASLQVASKTKLTKFMPNHCDQARWHCSKSGWQNENKIERVRNIQILAQECNSEENPLTLSKTEPAIQSPTRLVNLISNHRSCDSCSKQLCKLTQTPACKFESKPSW